MCLLLADSARPAHGPRYKALGVTHDAPLIGHATDDAGLIEVELSLALAAVGDRGPQGLFDHFGGATLREAQNVQGFFNFFAADQLEHGANLTVAGAQVTGCGLGLHRGTPTSSARTGQARRSRPRGL